MGLVGGGEWFHLQVPMVGKGVVESMLRLLGSVQGGGAEALAVQKAACSTLQNLTVAADNEVRGLVAGRCARAVCGWGLGARGDASAMRAFCWLELCLLSCRFLFHCYCHARRFGEFACVRCASRCERSMHVHPVACA
jgi:hypothetical protein